MGVQQQILNGARAQLLIAGKIVGVFTNCSWGVQYDLNPAYILGRYSPAELTYTGQEPINVTATGFRIIENGAYISAGLPKLQDLMTHEDIVLSLQDRQTGKTFLTVTGVRPMGYDSSVASRSISDFSVRFQGLKASDESGIQDEAPGATTLNSGT
jgi:hypothetical protein